MLSCNYSVATVPLVFLIGYMIVKSYYPQIDPGTPLVFCMGIVMALLCSKKKINFWKVSVQSMSESVEVMALFAAVGMMIQIMGLTGARGATVLGALKGKKIQKPSVSNGNHRSAACGG